MSAMWTNKHIHSEVGRCLERGRLILPNHQELSPCRPNRLSRPIEAWASPSAYCKLPISSGPSERQLRLLARNVRTVHSGSAVCWSLTSPRGHAIGLRRWPPGHHGLVHVLSARPGLTGRRCISGGPRCWRIRPRRAPACAYRASVRTDACT